MTYLESLNNKLHYLLNKDKDILILGEDIMDPDGGSFKVTKGLSDKYPDQVIPMPIAEHAITGFSIGLAMSGSRPVAEIMFGDFLSLCADGLINHAAKFPVMYNGEVKVPLVIRTPIGGGRGYGPTHSQSLERIFFGIKGLKLIAPSHFHDAGKELNKAIYDNAPVIFLESKLSYPVEQVNSDDIISISKFASDDIGYEIMCVKNFSNSKNELDVTILAYGEVSRELEKLMRYMYEEEINIEAFLPSCLNNIPVNEVAKSILKSGRLIILEGAQVDYGWGAECCRKIYPDVMKSLKGPIQCIGAESVIIPASYELEKKVLLNFQKIEEKIMETMEW